MDVPAFGLDVAGNSITEQWKINDGHIERITTAGAFTSTSYSHDTSPDLAVASTADLKTEWDKRVLRSFGSFEYAENNGTAGLIDLFSGCGGFSLGISQAALALGLKPKHRVAVDVDTNALAVYRRNFVTNDTIQKSVPELIDYKFGKRGRRLDFSFPPEVLSDTVAAWKDQITAVIGGPPCQGHSNFNNVTRRNDPRNSLYLTLPAVAVALNAPLVIIENVPAVLNDKFNVVDMAKKLLEAENYKVDDQVISAIDLGLPQTRRRHILVASKVSQPDLHSAKAVLARKPQDVRWAIGDLRVSDDLDDNFNRPADLSEENKARIDFLFNEDVYDLPNHVRPDCHKNGHTYPSVYGRLRLDQPSGTITTGFLSPGRGRYVHPSERRGLTPHEAARLQGLPDSFSFFDDSGVEFYRKTYAKLIGDAVPPAIGQVAGLAAFATLKPSDLKN